MDPALALIAFQFLCRWWARSNYNDAVADQRSAAEDYQYSLRRAHEERQRCLSGCKILAADRKAVLDARWTHLHTFITACGANGGLFAPPRGVFGEMPEEVVRLIVTNVKTLTTNSRRQLRRLRRALTRFTLPLQGFIWLETQHLFQAPILHQSLHAAASSLDSAAADSLADAMGSFGDVTVGDFIDGTLGVLSFAVSGVIFASAGNCWAKAAKLRDAADRLDERYASFKAANHRIDLLAAELETTSYELLKWTVVAQEAAKLRRATCGRRRNLSDLPRWILHGLLSKAKALWSTLEQPVFSETPE